MERIRAINGSTTREPTDKQRSIGRTVGTAVNRNCYVCRKYLKKDDSVNYVQTCFCCSLCKMPLCKESHYDVSIGRYFTCFEEHMVTDEEHMQCNGRYVIKSPFPKEYMVNLHTTTSESPRRSSSKSPRRSNTTTTRQSPRRSTRSNITSTRESPSQPRRLNRRRNITNTRQSEKEPRRLVQVMRQNRRSNRNK